MSKQTYGWATAVATVALFPLFAFPAGLLAGIESTNAELVDAADETKTVAESAQTDAQAALVTVGCALGFRMFNMAVSIATFGTASRPKEEPA